MFVLLFLSVSLFLFIFFLTEREGWQPQLPTLVLCSSFYFVIPCAMLSLVRLWIQLLCQSTELLRIITHFLREDGPGCSSHEEYRSIGP